MKNKNLNIMLIGLIALAFQIYGLKFYELADVQMYSKSNIFLYDYIQEPTVWIPMLISVFVIIIAYISGKEK